MLIIIGLRFASPSHILRFGAHSTFTSTYSSIHRYLTLSMDLLLIRPIMDLKQGEQQLEVVKIAINEIFRPVFLRFTKPLSLRFDYLFFEFSMNYLFNNYLEEI